jgi:hypothetical protein
VTEPRRQDGQERDWRGRSWRWGRDRPRPPWWPEDEPWPANRRPRGWRGFGCLFGLLFLVGFLGLVSLASHLVGGILAAGGPFGTLARVAAVLVGVAVLVGLARVARALSRSGAVLDELVVVA